MVKNVKCFNFLSYAVFNKKIDFPAKINKEIYSLCIFIYISIYYFLKNSNISPKSSISSGVKLPLVLTSGGAIS